MRGPTRAGPRRAPKGGAPHASRLLCATLIVIDLSQVVAQTWAAAAGSPQGEQAGALVYLQKYGYMQAPANGAETNNLVAEESFSGAVSDFQRFAGLPQTGLVDNQTLELMRLPRCGNSDKWRSAVIAKSGQLGRRRRKRYALQGSKWRRQELTYRISQYPTRFSGKRQEVESQIERAFGIWSQVAPIDFVVKREGRVHIDIRFASGDHGDGDAFDGPGNTLAHAYFPQYGGDAHFDDQEYWTIDSYAGTNIFQVAAHELGHSLGLGHSNVREALMAPFYQKYKPHFRLHPDDVLAIQALYGEKPTGEASLGPLLPSATSTSTSAPAAGETSPPPTTRSIYRGVAGKRPASSTTSSTTAAPTPEPDENGFPELPGNGIGSGSGSGSGNGNGSGGGVNTLDGELPTAVGPGSSHGPGAAAAYPADLCSDGAIDAVTRTEDGNTYVFKGDFYWLLANEGLARDYPRRISLDWQGLPGQLDAALTWADGKTFFFKGNKYWRFKNKRRDLGYPKLISAGFAGVPDDLDAALVWAGNGRTYFFKGAEYWRFDSKADPPVGAEYPRSVKVWMGVPAHLNAAFKWENNVTYFFKGNQYYRFNDKEFRVEARGRPAFPRHTGEWWFGCVNSNLAQRALSGSLRHLRAGETMAAQVAAGVTSGRPQEPLEPRRQLAPSADDWSLLAGLAEDASRPLGTHISDHHHHHHHQHRPAPAVARSSEVESGQLDELSPAWLAAGQTGEPRRVEPPPPPPGAISKRSGSAPPPPLSSWNGENLFRAGGFSRPLQAAASSSSSSSAILNSSVPLGLLLLLTSLVNATLHPRRPASS